MKNSDDKGGMHPSTADAVAALGTFAIVGFLAIAVNFLIIAWLCYEILRDFRGADRLCWLAVVQVPIFGLILYVVLGLKEREEAARMQR